MNFIKNFINKELLYFQKLHSDARRLIVSIFLRDLIGPIFGLFINAFLWRQTHDMILVAFFNLILYLFIPFAFYVNGILLKKFPANHLYYGSLGIQALAITSLIFLNDISYTTIFSFAVVNSITAGMYWANRNLLTLKATKSEDRIYFTSIEASSSSLTDVIIPLCMGWFIALGAFVHLYSAEQGYQMISVMMLGFVLWIAVIMYPHSKKFSIGSLFVHQVTKSWQGLRLVQFFSGLSDGLVVFIPTLMVLILVGNEEALGTIQSFSALIGSLVIYFLSKHLTVKHRTLLFSISDAFLILGGSIFGIFYSALAVAIFFACYAIAMPFSWVPLNSLSYDLIDDKQENHKYAYVCDQEIYLNGGRVLAILLFILAIQFFSNEQALRFAPFVMGLSQILLLIAAHKTEKYHKGQMTPQTTIKQLPGT